MVRRPHRQRLEGKPVPVASGALVDCSVDSPAGSRRVQYRVRAPLPHTAGRCAEDAGPFDIFIPSTAWGLLGLGVFTAVIEPAGFLAGKSGYCT